MIAFPSIPEVLPEGECGIAKVEHYEVSCSDSMFTSIRTMQHPGAFVSEGKYAKLMVGHRLMMSDTSMERRSNYEVVRQARGNVLIAGLGLGMIVHPILRKPEVTSVEVIEKYQDVIDLVAPEIQKWEGGEKFSTIHADVLDWKPTKGRKWDTIYFDIWTDICTDNLDEISTLHRRFARRKPSDGWMGSWMRERLQSQRRWDKAQRGRYR